MLKAELEVGLCVSVCVCAGEYHYFYACTSIPLIILFFSKPCSFPQKGLQNIYTTLVLA